MVGDHDDAHDILQNVFIKVWKALGDFREQSQIYTWLYRIATNETLTFMEKRKRRASVSLDNEDYALSERVAAGEPSVDGEQLQARLQKAIDGLPDKQKLVFNLRYFEEMPYEKMSEILGTSVGALKASYHHAVKKIEAYFNPKD
jgi:RNA polymerase sigma-70 factor (ECF subfamily)